jgi:transcriptional antiterminator RfaH
MKSFKEGWYLIYTKPRHEKKVHHRLTEMNISSFLPTKKKLHASRGRKSIVDYPLFPSYVFIYLNDMQNYYHGIDTEGSLYYVKTGETMARVQDAVVNNIRISVSQAKELEISETRFEPGRKLVINKGPLTGLTCEVVESGNREKLLVRVDLLQRNILLTLPEDNLMLL